ncbi:hypothetical protein AUJ65_02290 [Candidatus Micrarchaeota archaeon CG1_02_51_15]|nr:MAG: hypothetical protein AUJ65_02290 [Candidatus Micrarchaeota archaeon CG1_02_51_15]
MEGKEFGIFSLLERKSLKGGFGREKCVAAERGITDLVRRVGNPGLREAFDEQFYAYCLERSHCH